jgi:WXG100 family type VII secretion target
MVNVHFHALAQAADDVRAAHGALVTEKEGMDHFLLKLRGTWHGTGGSSWQSTQNNWNASCNDINSILLSLFMALEQALANYQGTERRVTQGWGG